MLIVIVHTEGWKNKKKNEIFFFFGGGGGVEIAEIAR